MPVTIGGGLSFCGRELTPEEFDLIRQITRDFSTLALTELAHTICELLEWRRPNGGPKSRECYLFLQALQARGWLPGLPPAKPIQPRPRTIAFDETSAAQLPLTGSISDYSPVQLQWLTSGEDRRLFRQYIQRYHYLGYKVPYGAQLRYFVRSPQSPGAVLACLLFTSAAWKMAPRDVCIGWGQTARQANLPLIVNHSRFLILPWVRVPNLASHILALAARQMPLLLETLVDQTRYHGGCYRAANWMEAGLTQGRGRMDSSGQAQGARKLIFLFPLHRHWRERVVCQWAFAAGGCMNLLETFDDLLQGWRPAFAEVRTFVRARRLTLGLLVCMRRHLTSQAICATGRQFVDWTADYRLCSRCVWDPRQLFDPVFDRLSPLLSSPEAPVIVAVDDTLCRKSRKKKIPGVTLARDPQSPAFRVNFCYGLRFVTLSVLIPPGVPGPARALPVRFELAPPAEKPKKGASAEEQAAYRQEKKQRALTVVGRNAMASVRQSMDRREDLHYRRLILCGDGSYTNRNVLKHLTERTTYIGRIRKDAKLHWPSEQTGPKAQGRPRRYGAVSPTPEQILHDASVPWVKVWCFVAGELREVSVKVVGPVYWRKAGVEMPLQVVVIRPAGYRLRKGSKLLYRQPAFLICTDGKLDLQTLVQAYVYRWEIECNHRDEKSLLGVGQGQVRNPEAVRRLPQLQVAAYSLLLLATLLSSGTERTAEFLPLPKWRKQPIRASVLDILALLREQIFARVTSGSPNPLLSFDGIATQAALDAKSTKKPLTADTLCTAAA